MLQSLSGLFSTQHIKDLASVELIGLQFNKAYTHSGTAFPKCAYQLPCAITLDTTSLKG